MLVLTRCLGETVAIGDDVRVRVVGVRGSRVRLGIEAPDDVAIVREGARVRRRARRGAVRDGPFAVAGPR